MMNSTLSPMQDALASPTRAPSYYSIIQCVPDPLTDERINIGVVAFDAYRFYVQGLQDWNRVQQFAGKAVRTRSQQFVKDLLLASQRQTAALLQLSLLSRERDWSPQLLQQIIESWSGTIQFLPTEPSTASARETLDLVVNIYLHEPARVDRIYRRRQLAENAKSTLRTTLVNRLPSEMSRRISIDSGDYAGQLKADHAVDLLVSSGLPLAVGQAISFGGSSPTYLEDLIDDAMFSFSDLRRLSEYSDVPMSYIYEFDDTISMNSNKGHLLAYLRHGCGVLEVAPIQAEYIPDWASDLTTRISAVL